MKMVKHHVIAALCDDSKLMSGHPITKKELLKLASQYISDKRVVEIRIKPKR
jgi:hypothetical protein